MGSGIAGTAVTTAGVDVRLKDTDLTRVGKGLKAAGDILNHRLKRRRISRFEYQRLSALLSGGADYSGFGLIDLRRRGGVRRSRAQAPGPDGNRGRDSDHCRVRHQHLDHSHLGNRRGGCPSRPGGWHALLLPVDRMPLLEIIPTEQTSAETIVTAVHFGRKLGKTVIVVRDRPGFWVNRILTPYMNEAGFCCGKACRWT